MGLRIRTNISSLNAQRKLGETTTRLTSSMERLAGGQRINRAGDDAAGLGMAEKMTAQVRSLAQAKRNANDGVSLIQVAESGMNEISQILVRLRELAVQAASDTLGLQDRGLINAEYSQLIEEIDRIGNVTEFNGLPLFDGGAKAQLERLTLHVGSGDGSVANRDTIELDLKPLKVQAQETFGLNSEVGLGEQVDSDSQAGREAAAQKLSVLDLALSKVSRVRAELGAKQNRLDSTLGTLASAHENMTASHSRIRDVDFAAETATYTQNRILQQSGVSVLSQANTLPELALALLR